MKRWVAMLLVLVFTLSGCGLMEDINEKDPAANPVAGNTGTDADYLSLTAELEQARQVKLELGSEAQACTGIHREAIVILGTTGNLDAVIGTPLGGGRMVTHTESQLLKVTIYVTTGTAKSVADGFLSLCVFLQPIPATIFVRPRPAIAEGERVGHPFLQFRRGSR